MTKLAVDRFVIERILSHSERNITAIEGPLRPYSLSAKKDRRTTCIKVSSIDSPTIPLRTTRQ
jgi:hypothetical protein